MPFSSKYHSYASVMDFGMIDERRTGFGTPYKFNAKELDCESGYYYYVNELVEDIEMSSERVKRSTSPAVPSIRDEERMRSRYYDPRMSRFLSVDPKAGDFPHLSSYNYAENSPVTNIDLHGLQAVSADIVADIRAAEMQGGDLVRNFKRNRSFVNPPAADIRASEMQHFGAYLADVGDGVAITGYFLVHRNNAYLIL